MCVKLPLGDLNPDLFSHILQALILVEWPSYQGCVVVHDVELKQHKPHMLHVLSNT